VPRYTKSFADEIAGLKIGVPIDLFGEGVDPTVEHATRDAIDVLVDLGAEALEISMPSLKYALSAYYVLAM
jgi:aspartyl-tRNA(Asn)/glutamyl-tRNA(Gln) amidotransferase subunit A